LDDAPAATLPAFYTQVYEQSERLHGAAKKEFQERWDLDLEYDVSDQQSNMFGSDNIVPSGISANVRKMLFCAKENRTRKLILSEAIEATSQFSKERIRKLKVASNAQIGLENLHLFIIDLLG
jgi:hypothetical protein